MYSQDLDLNIVEDEKWWSDDYDFFSFGREYDFQVPFFEQFSNLQKVVPLPHLQRAFATFQNSNYCNAASGLKNCYLITNANNNESCMYGFAVEECKDCVDIIFTNKSELCYEMINIKSCYGCAFCENCEVCNDLLFCKDCIGCKNCFGCIGLRQKSYHIFNKLYSQDEYKQKMAELHTGSWNSLRNMKEQAETFFLSVPQKYMHERSNQNVRGDYIYQSKDVQDSYIVEMSEKCKFSHFLRYLSSGTHDAYDYTMFGVGADLVYDSAWCGLGIHNIKFSVWNYGSSDLEYCYGCHYSTKLFGCIGLRHQKYCILNKQYSEEEYGVLLPKIKEQMMHMPYKDKNGIFYHYGEFFPVEISPFHYNQTLAQDFCPLKEQKCIDQNYGWYQCEERQTTNFLDWKNLPDDINDVDNQILAKPILCKAYDEKSTEALAHNCTKVFKITAQELDFYKRMQLPIPRYCYNTRHYQKLRKLNPFKTWKRSCNKCDNEIHTSYAPDRPEVVYCEECYMKEVY